MQKNKFYSLPDLFHDYNELEPYISEKQLRIHHNKHHSGYIKGSNEIFEKLEKARKEGIKVDIKAILKALSFNAGGHILHSLFWSNLAPPNKGGGGESKGRLAIAIKNEFGSFERFKKEFSEAANSVEGSGWAALTYCKKTQRLIIMQIEKHNNNVFPSFKILMVLDVWEHAYYLDYKNERGKFVDAFWNIVNWKEVSKRFEELLK